MTLSKILAVNILVTLFLFFSIDFFYSHIAPSPSKKIMNGNHWDEIVKKRKIYRRKHPVFHHDLVANFKGTGIWYKDEHELCTNSYGFKASCQSDIGLSYYDIAFIGDSFTEAVDMSYEESFVGLVASKLKGRKIANMGVVSYSPSIYLSKINYLLNQGVLFDHLIVMIDISDIKDDGVHYTVNRDLVVSDFKGNKGPRRTESKIKAPSCLDSFATKSLSKFLEHHFKLTCLMTNYFQYNTFESLSDIPVRDHRADWTHNPTSPSYGIAGVDGAIEQSLNLMGRLYELLQERGIKLSIGVYPWPDQIFYDDLLKSKQINIWQDFCFNRCESFINAFAPFESLKERYTNEQIYYRYYINGDLHFNVDGNALIADSILKNLNR